MGRFWSTATVKFPDGETEMDVTTSNFEEDGLELMTECGHSAVCLMESSNLRLSRESCRVSVTSHGTQPDGCT